MKSEIRNCVNKVACRVKEAGDMRFAEYLEDQAQRTDLGLEEFLRSNEMWGGSGSVADSAGVGDRIKRKQVEEALIELGESQLKEGITNPRVTVWIDIFRQWKTQGI